MLEQLTLETFSPLVHQPFRIHYGGEAPLEVVLAEAKLLGGSSLHRAPFSLLFVGGPRDRYLPQRIYRVEHETLGTLELFLVPLGPDHEAMRYQAIFT